MSEREVEQEALKKARAYVQRLFKLRPRSSQELRDKFRTKGVDSQIGEKLIEDFLRAGILDDAAFARAWMQSRLKKYGFRRVEQELKDKGIAREKVAELRCELQNDYDEEAIVRSVAKKRMASRAQSNVDLLKRRQRVTGYLLRRGFSPGVVGKVMREFKG